MENVDAEGQEHASGCSEDRDGEPLCPGPPEKQDESGDDIGETREEVEPKDEGNGIAHGSLSVSSAKKGRAHLTEW